MKKIIQKLFKFLNVNDESSKRLLKLKIRIALLIILLFAVIILAMSYYSIDSQSEMLKKNMMRMAEREIERLQRSAGIALTFGDELGLLQ